MVYFVADDNQLRPSLIPIQIHSLPSNQMRISLSPPNIGTYRIYMAYRNLPINGKSFALTYFYTIEHNERNARESLEKKGLVRTRNMSNMNISLNQIDHYYCWWVFFLWTNDRSISIEDKDKEPCSSSLTNSKLNVCFVSFVFYLSVSCSRVRSFAHSLARWFVFDERILLGVHRQSSRGEYIQWLISIWLPIGEEMSKRTSTNNNDRFSSGLFVFLWFVYFICTFQLCTVQSCIHFCSITRNKTRFLRLAHSFSLRLHTLSSFLFLLLTFLVFVRATRNLTLKRRHLFEYTYNVRLVFIISVLLYLLLDTAYLLIKIDNSFLITIIRSVGIIVSLSIRKKKKNK
jgi:hypothetical protein